MPDRVAEGLGMLGPVDDTQAMAANVAALWRSGRAAAIGAAARSHVVARYSWTRAFERLLGEIYPAALRHAAMRAPEPRRAVRRGAGVAGGREREGRGGSGGARGRREGEGGGREG